MWTADISIPEGIDIKYRYATCIFVEDSVNHEQKVVVRRWETALKSRKIGCHGRKFAIKVFREDEPPTVSSSDICDSNHVDQFAVIPNQLNPGSLPKTQRGWLVNETLVQLKIHGHNVLQIWKKKHHNKDFYIKVTPIETSKANPTSPQCSFDLEESLDISQTREERKVWPIVEVSVSF